MPNFVQIFKERGNISFVGMRDTAISLLPMDRTRRNKLYDDLERGKGILDDDDHLNMYLHSFGKMHKAKLDMAFNSMSGADVFCEEVEVFDWGCGQGTATICLFDFLKEKHITPNIKQIYLVEPSSAATKRASDVIKCYNPSYSVSTITKDFDSLEATDFKRTNTRKVHLFSNILDVEAFDLAKFIHLFQQVFGSDNYFICVGPYYSNNRRVDEFVAATAPDVMYATLNKERGTWQGEWTISMRIFFKRFDRIETIENIRKRIEDTHKKEQFFAGFILDSVSEEYTKSDKAEETEGLYRALSMFDVKSNIPLGYNIVNDSKLAVLANIISRGLPTKAPLFLENIFSDIYNISTKPDKNALVEYKSTHKLRVQEIYEALHVIDPRFNVEFYNGDMLESSFEKGFIDRYLKGTQSEYLIQVFEPQRPLSSIVDIPDKQFSKDQRVDFALEIPYGDARTGFILEMDGRRYHSNIFSRLNDERRDKMALQGGWDTYRIEQLHNMAFMNNWETDAASVKYLATLKANFGKKLSGSWLDTLQIVLAPLAIARVERMMVEAMMAGILRTDAEKWNIAIIERDVPCAAIAITDLKEKYEQICSLAGSDETFPPINLCIVSTEEFKNSPLHLGNTITTNMPEAHFDLCMDVSMFLRDNIDALSLNVDADIVYLIRSSHYSKRERTVCTAENIQYPPLVQKDGTGSYVIIKEREEILTYFLRDIFRKPSFRPGQLPILSHALADKTTIGLLPTGGGKSLTYQLSCILQPGVSIIVDPLVSLMVDQVRGLREARIDACDCVNSGMDAKEKAKKLNMLQNGAVLFMLLSPERFMMENFRSSLLTMTEKNHVYFSYGIIDEVHCVSEWGHDFRTSYLHLGRNMINFMHTKSERPLSIIGLTATASFDVLADVERELTLGGNLTIDSETIVRPESDARPELTYRIVEVRSNFDELREPSEQYVLKAKSDWELKDVVATEKKNRMYSLIHEIPYDIALLNQNETTKTKIAHISGFESDCFFAPDSTQHYPNAGIIFCPHAHGTFGVEDNVWGTRTGISTELRANGQDLVIGTFVGGDHPSGDMKLFNENEQSVMVATKAFGMGIDKPNIRYTIHVNHPSSIESYVQEAGRGGRDKKHAISYVLFDPTEYIELTIDKINDIRYLMGQDDPVWLERYINKFILADDIRDLCQHNGATDEQIDRILDIIRKQGFLENIDKDINLWFHNNSFRGLFKEKVILVELTDRIMNAKPTRLIEVQGKLRDLTGNEDLCLKVSAQKKSITVFSEEDNNKQYGYIFLDTLTPTYRYTDFDYNLCSYISGSLIDILTSCPEHTPAYLLKPLEGEDNIIEGIYQAMANADEDGNASVVVSWENNIKQDPEGFEKSIKDEISKISQAQGWADINEDRYGKLDLKKIEDFEQLIAKIAKCSGDTAWLRHHADRDVYRKLRMAFCKKRDKDDTDKAIYRLCCIGLVDDVTIDYLSQTYELKIHKRTDEEFKQYMLDFFRKYYSTEQAQKKVNEIDKQEGRNYLDKCLGYLTAFVYDNLEKKRYRAIEDMRIACEDSIIERQANGDDEWLKEFIHLYFNSKYARTGYQVNGKPYSLKDDTDIDGRDGFDVVQKYIEIINPANDNSGSEIDNIKHLYGATLLCLRAHPDNAALQLLLTYCITVLGAGNNETLKSNAYNNYIEGFMSLYQNTNSEVWDYIDQFNSHLASKVRDDDDFIRDKLIENGKKMITLFIHEEKINEIVNKYLNI